MSDPVPEALAAGPALASPEGSAGAPAAKSRTALVKRLADVVCLPASRVNAFEKAVTADLLVEMLAGADAEQRLRVAKRLAGLTDIPPVLARLLLRDGIETAAPLLIESQSLNDCELLDCVANAQEAHRLLIAGRKHVGEAVAEALVARHEPAVIEALLRNEGARLAHATLETLVAMARTRRALIALLLRRRELRPSHAYILFWWADAAGRRTVLQRFAVSREVLQEAASDVFPMAAQEGWNDRLSRMALQFIERRQRNRAAIEKSPFGSLEDVIATASAGRGMTPELAREIAFLSGLRPATAARILADEGGEPVAVLCKATGLTRPALAALWRAMRRDDVDADGEPTPDFERVASIFDMMGVDRAQTVLRYWNWALSAALGADVKSDGDAPVDAAPARVAMLGVTG